MRRLFGCPDIVSLTEKFLMARNFFRIFTENNPVMGYSKTFFIPEAKGLKDTAYYWYFLEKKKYINRPVISQDFSRFQDFVQHVQEKYTEQQKKRRMNTRYQHGRLHTGCFENHSSRIPSPQYDFQAQS